MLQKLKLRAINLLQKKMFLMKVNNCLQFPRKLLLLQNKISKAKIKHKKKLESPDSDEPESSEGLMQKEDQNEQDPIQSEKIVKIQLKE